MILVKSLDTVAKEAEGESAGWTVKLIIFVGGTCGSVHVQTFNSNLKELGVVESKRNTMGRNLSKDWKDLKDNWVEAVERNMDRKVWVDRASEQVDVGRLKQDGRAGGGQPEPSIRGSGLGRAPIADLQN